MDSKNIFISYEHYARNIDWERSGESEWIYVGADEEFDVEKVNNLVNSFFTEDELYLITDRHTSLLIKKTESVKFIKDLLHEFTPALANQNFTKIIEFDKIGVLRKGNRI